MKLLLQSSTGWYLVPAAAPHPNPVLKNFDKSLEFYWAPLLVSLFILGKCLLVSLRYEVLQYGKVNDKVIDIFSKGWIN